MFWPGPEGELGGAEREGRGFEGVPVGSRESVDSDSCLDSLSSSAFLTLSGGFETGLESSDGISRLDMSSPSSAMTAIRVPTWTLLLPSWAKIFAMIPSSCASTSMVALSVSISRSTSPVEKASPSFTFQEEMLPSVIVGDMAGIVKLWASERKVVDANVRCEIWE